MSDELYITAFCSIRDNQVNTNHSILFHDEKHQGEEFLKAAYRHYQLNYPKFFKMDALSRLGVLTSELLLRNNKVTERYKSSNIAMVLANRSSSLHTDMEHQRTIGDKENYFPSPSVFVYTLPNIVAGEIAIRNSIKGENSFFIFDKFDPRFMATYTESLMANNKADCVIAGWIEYFGGHMHSFLYTVERQPGIVHEIHNTENISKLFH